MAFFDNAAVPQAKRHFNAVVKIVVQYHLRGVQNASAAAHKHVDVDDRKDRERFVTRMGEVATEKKTAIYAWSLLTNHAHILLCSGPSGLPKFMRRLLTYRAHSAGKIWGAAI